MWGDTSAQVEILSAGTLDQLMPADHPIRQVKPLVDGALMELSPTFRTMYAKVGRPPSHRMSLGKIPP